MSFSFLMPFYTQASLVLTGGISDLRGQSPRPNKSYIFKNPQKKNTKKQVQLSPCSMALSVG